MKKLFIFLYVGALLSGCGGSDTPKATKVENDKGKDATKAISPCEVVVHRVVKKPKDSIVGKEIKNPGTTVADLDADGIVLADENIVVVDSSDMILSLSYDTDSLHRAERGGIGGGRQSLNSLGVASPQAYAVGIDQGQLERETGVPRLLISGEEPSTEEYDRIYENPFLEAKGNPLSTFSIDVDTASYANSRRFLRDGQLPPKDAVRIEEFINYFDYDYPAPTGTDPFSTNCELSACPWNEKHELLLVGLQGRKIDLAQLPPNNLVFLADVSGSMNSPRKLPLLKASLRLLVNNLRPEDRVALVVYAGAAGLVLDSTPGTDRQKIIEAIDNLSAGGSTAGGAGIKLAYQVAKENFISKGNNRIILATDGDFNVGQSSDADLTRLVEEKRDDGVYLTVLGLGRGNYKDSKMEKLADKGNGNYAYVDNIREAKKALVTEVGGTLFTIAKDVKLQIEFNPATVSSYRLIGYENRILKAEDFNNDKKDAGELGAGHRVTALYEIVRVGTEEPVAKVDKLKYQKKVKLTKSKDLLTLKLRYKEPKEDESQLITKVIQADEITVEKPSENWALASAVAEFALLMRDSQHKGTASFESALTRARSARGQDEHGYRTELAQLIEEANLLARN